MTYGIQYISKEGENNDLIDHVENILVEKDIVDEELEQELNEIREKYEEQEGNEIMMLQDELEEFKLAVMKTIVHNPDEALVNGLVGLVHHRVEKESREHVQRRETWNKSPREAIQEIEDVEQDAFQVKEKFIGNSDYLVIFIPQAHSTSQFSDYERGCDCTPSQKELKKYVVSLAQLQGKIYTIGKLLLEHGICNTFSTEGVQQKIEVTGKTARAISLGGKTDTIPDEIYFHHIALPAWIDYGAFFALEEKHEDSMQLIGAENMDVHQVASSLAYGVVNLAYLKKEIKRDRRFLKKKQFFHTNEDFIEWMKLNPFADKKMIAAIKDIILGDGGSIYDKFSHRKVLKKMSQLKKKYIYEKRHEGVMDAIEQIHQNIGMNVITIPFGANHFLKENRGTRYDIFQEVCKERSISYMILEPTNMDTFVDEMK